MEAIGHQINTVDDCALALHFAKILYTTNFSSITEFIHERKNIENVFFKTCQYNSYLVRESYNKTIESIEQINETLWLNEIEKKLIEISKSKDVLSSKNKGEICECFKKAQEIIRTPTIMRKEKTNGNLLKNNEKSPCTPTAKNFRSQSIEFNVKGVSFSNSDGTSRQEILRHVNAGDLVDIQHEYLNTYHSKALMVMTKLGCIGYVPRILADEIFEDLFHLKSAMIVSIGKTSNSLYGCIIKITFNYEVNLTYDHHHLISKEDEGIAIIEEIIKNMKHHESIDDIKRISIKIEENRKSSQTFSNHMYDDYGDYDEIDYYDNLNPDEGYDYGIDMGYLEDGD